MQRASGRDVVRYQGNEAIAQVIEMRLPMGRRYGYIARGPSGRVPTLRAMRLLHCARSSAGDLFLRVDLPRAAALASIQKAWDGRGHPTIGIRCATFDDIDHPPQRFDRRSLGRDAPKDALASALPRRRR